MGPDSDCDLRLGRPPDAGRLISAGFQRVFSGFSAGALRVRPTVTFASAAGD